MQVTGEVVSTINSGILSPIPRIATIELPEVDKSKITVGDTLLIPVEVRGIGCFLTVYINSTKFLIGDNQAVYHIPFTPPQDSIVVPGRYDEPSNSKWCSTHDHNLIVNCLTQMKAAIDNINKRMDEKEGK